jgi:uncharacterized membrane protein
VPLSCPQCGIEIPDNTAFCPGCGRNTAQPVLGTTGGIRDNIAGALAYFTFIPAIIFLVVEPFKNNRFIRFHALQSIFMTIVGLAAGLALKLVFLILSLIPWLGHLLLLLISVIIFLGCVILWLVLLVKALQGELFKLPFIGELALRQASKV